MELQPIMHNPTYADLLRVNVTLLLHIVTKPLLKADSRIG